MSHTLNVKSEMSGLRIQQHNLPMMKLEHQMFSKKSLNRIYRNFLSNMVLLRMMFHRKIIYTIKVSFNPRLVFTPFYNYDMMFWYMFYLAKYCIFVVPKSSIVKGPNVISVISQLF